MHPSVPCLVCGRELRPAYPEAAEAQPYGGTAFASSGHYGSTVFDGSGGQWIEINLCDPCLRDGADRGRVLMATPPDASPPPPSYALFAAGPVDIAGAVAAPAIPALAPVVVTDPVDSIRDVVVEPDLWAVSAGPCPCTHYEDDASGAEVCACGHGRDEHEARGDCLVGRS